MADNIGRLRRRGFAGRAPSTSMPFIAGRSVSDSSDETTGDSCKCKRQKAPAEIRRNGTYKICRCTLPRQNRTDPPDPPPRLTVSPHLWRQPNIRLFPPRNLLRHSIRTNGDFSRLLLALALRVQTWTRTRAGRGSEGCGRVANPRNVRHARCEGWYGRRCRRRR